MASKHIPALDGVRGLAVLMVVLLHTAGGAQSHILLVALFGKINRYGWTAVTLFFVLSGFLITGILNDTRDDPHRLRNFYMRRSLRIFPLYYAALLLALLAAIPAHLVRACLAHLPVYLFYLQNVPPFDLHPAPLPSPLHVSHFWSLAVEEQFYLLWPFLVYRAKSHRGTTLLCLAVVTASTIYKLANPGLDTDSLFANAGALALGGWLAMLYRTPHWRWAIRHAPEMFAASIAILIALFRAHAPVNGPVLTALSVACAALLAMSLTPGIVQRLFSMRWLRWIGTISYGMYVYHLLLLGVVTALVTHLAPGASRNLHLALRFILSFSTTILLSWLSFRFFESPLIRRKRRFQPKPAAVLQ